MMVSTGIVDSDVTGREKCFVLMYQHHTAYIDAHVVYYYLVAALPALRVPPLHSLIDRHRRGIGQ